MKHLTLSEIGDLGFTCLVCSMPTVRLPTHQVRALLEEVYLRRADEWWEAWEQLWWQVGLMEYAK